MNKEDAGSAAAKGKGKRRWPIVVGVVAVVLVCAGIGFNAWHNQPSFCNAICHTPMDYYVDATMRARNGARQLGRRARGRGVTCLQCHEATLEAQVNEGRRGFPARTASRRRQLAAAADHGRQGAMRSRGVPRMARRGGRHRELGRAAGREPARVPPGEAIDCSNCHSVHGESNMYCNACHSYEVPAGWASPASN